MRRIQEEIGAPLFEDSYGKIKFWHQMYRKMLKMYRDGVEPAKIKETLEEEFEEEIVQHVIKRLQ